MTLWSGRNDTETLEPLRAEFKIQAPRSRRVGDCPNYVWSWEANQGWGSYEEEILAGQLHIDVETICFIGL